MPEKGNIRHVGSIHFSQETIEDKCALLQRILLTGLSTNFNFISFPSEEDVVGMLSRSATTAGEECPYKVFLSRPMRC